MKIIRARSLNHSLETIISIFKNPTNSRDILLKTFTEIACGNKVSAFTSIIRVGLSFTENHVILPAKSNYLQKTGINFNSSNNRVRQIAAGNPQQCPVGVLYKKLLQAYTEN